MAQASAVAAQVPLLRKSALRKARWRLLPLLGICYLVAYMDRANISFAAETMNRDLGFSAGVYGLGAGLFFLSYAICEIPSNAALLRFGARRWLARIMLTWGLVAVAMMFVRGTRSFYGLRLLLGVAEAGYFPGVMYYLSLWFPTEERARAISRFYISLPISTIVMGLAAGSLLHLEGRFGLHGWQWLFLVEGLPAVLLSVCVWTLLPDGPATAAWLSPEEKLSLEIAHIATSQIAHDRRGHNSDDFWRVLRTGRIWALGAVYFCGFVCTYGLNFSLPLLLRQTTAWSPAYIGDLIAVMGVLGAGLMLSNASHSDRKRERTWHIVVPFCFMIAGCVVASQSLHSLLGAVALLIVTLGWFTLQGPLLGACTSVVAGRGGAVAIATINMCGITGGFLGPYWLGFMRDRTGSYAWSVGMLALPCAVAIIALVVLGRLRPLEEAEA